MGKRDPDEGQGEAFENHAEDQQVEVGLTMLPVADSRADPCYALVGKTKGELMKTFALVGTVALLASTAFAQQSSRLDEVIQKKTVRVCTTGDYKPFSYLDPATKAYEGIDIDMARSLASSLGAEAQFVPTTWKTLMEDFTAGKCDIAMGGISINLPRQTQAFFTNPYLVDGKTPIARCEDVQKFQTLEQIDQPNVRVIVNPGGTNEAFAKANIKRANLTVYPDNVTIFDQITEGKADVMITDAIETRLQQKLRPKLCAVHPDKAFTFSEKGYLLPRGDVAFKEYVDQWLNLALKSGEYQRTSDKWLK